ncbi:Protein of unknown function [Pyronema omphalodes CBS 100304]|uniref:Uncharacterized protein n=1 Tax=Pyronema omphalodes (strain CBS 100304) TaxID=1076935 RepID=U4L8G2_PYROM|nr:Protein of unknown function [Pyronema omphalodes CBS 100304]
MSIVLNHMISWRIYAVGKKRSA